MEYLHVCVRICHVLLYEKLLFSTAYKRNRICMYVRLCVLCDRSNHLLFLPPTSSSLLTLFSLSLSHTRSPFIPLSFFLAFSFFFSFFHFFFVWLYSDTRGKKAVGRVRTRRELVGKLWGYVALLILGYHESPASKVGSALECFSFSHSFIISLSFKVRDRATDD